MSAAQGRRHGAAVAHRPGRRSHRAGGPAWPGPAPAPRAFGPDGLPPATRPGGPRPERPDLGAPCGCRIAALEGHAAHPFEGWRSSPRGCGVADPASRTPSPRPGASRPSSLLDSDCAPRASRPRRSSAQQDAFIESLDGSAWAPSTPRPASPSPRRHALIGAGRPAGRRRGPAPCGGLRNGDPAPARMPTAAEHPAGQTPAGAPPPRSHPARVRLARNDGRGPPPGWQDAHATPCAAAHPHADRAEAAAPARHPADITDGFLAARPSGPDAPAPARDRGSRSGLKDGRNPSAPSSRSSGPTPPASGTSGTVGGFFGVPFGERAPA